MYNISSKFFLLQRTLQIHLFKFGNQLILIYFPSIQTFVWTKWANIFLTSDVIIHI